MKKILFGVLLTVASLSAASLSAQAQQSIDTATRYDDGARWAFISDEKTTALAVVDTFNFKHVDTLTLQAVPTEITVSDVQDILVYIDGKKNLIYTYDLVTKKHDQIPTDLLPENILFHADGAQLAVTYPNKIEIIKPLEKTKVATIEGLRSPFTLNFDNGGYNLFITEMETGSTLIYRNHDGRKENIALAKGKVSELTLSPDMRLAMLADRKNKSISVWDLSIDAPFKTYEMQAEPWRPYVSSDSEYMIFAAQNGQTMVVNAWSGDVVDEFKLNGQPSAIRTGWLETIGIVETGNEISIFSLEQKEDRVTLPLKHKLQEIVVVSDSKTLFATQKDNSELFVYDIREKQARPMIDVGLKNPRHLGMGITNTVCH